jgi:hypothetical protein
MNTIRTSLTTVGLAALAVGAFNPAAALAAPAPLSAGPDAAGPTSSIGATTTAVAAPQVRRVDVLEPDTYVVSGVALGADMVNIFVPGGGGGLAPVNQDRFTLTISGEHAGETLTLTARGPGGVGTSSPVQITLERFLAPGEDQAPSTPVVHAVTDYGDDVLVVEGTVAADPMMFERAVVVAPTLGLVYDAADSNGAFSLRVPKEHAGSTIQIQATRSGLLGDLVDVELVETEGNTASEVFPLEVASPAVDALVPAGETVFTGSGIPNSEISVTRDAAGLSTDSALCETRVLSSGDWSCTSTTLPVGAYETTVTETPTWKSAPTQRAGAAFSVVADLLPSEKPVLPKLWSVSYDREGGLVVRVIANNAFEARMTIDGEEVDTIRGPQGRFAFTLDPALLGSTAVVTGLRGDVESAPLEIPLELVEAPAASPIEAPIVHHVFRDGDEGRFYIAATTNYFPDEYIVPGATALVDGSFAGASEAAWNGAFFLQVAAEHAGEQVELFTTRGDGTRSPSTVVDLVVTEGNTAGETFPLDVSSPAEGETVAADTTTFRGEGIPGSRVLITSDVTRSTTLGAASVLPDGTWTAEIAAPLPSGDQTVTVTETPYWENLDPIVSTRSFVVAEDGDGGEETPAPAAPVTIATPADVTTGYTPNAPFTFTGTAEPGSTLTVTNAKGLSLGTAVEVNDDGEWTWTRSNMGSYTWTMDFTTDAGTDRAQTTRLTGFAPREAQTAPVTIDTPADVATGYAPDTAFTFGGTAEPGAEITVTNAKGLSLGAAVEVNSDGDWTWTRSNMGSYTWTMIFTADAGTDRQQAATLAGFAPRASTIAPVVVTNPADTSTGYTANEAFTFTGTAEPGSTLTVTNAKGLSLGTTVEVNDDGDWTWTRTNMGSYTWTILFTTHADTDDQQQTRLTGFAPRN